MGFKAKTCVRYNEPWQAHALTFSCYHRQPLLSDAAACRALVGALETARRRLAFDLWAYVIMPEHVHLVIWPRREEYSISRILSAIKRPVAFRLGAGKRAGLEHFWQPGGGYDRNLWKVATIHKEVDYLHNNPVRRELCQMPGQWQYSSAAFYEGQNDVPLSMDDSLPPRESLGSA
ncbi:MAG TPA: hypothetical protein DCX07_03495 [Phycisphaerales bacterium]|nr:hypothetical protein [Phycisphaerales bacterium]